MRAIAIAIVGLVAGAAALGGGVPAAAATTRPAAPRTSGVMNALPGSISCGSTRACLAVGSPYFVSENTSGSIVSVSRTTALGWNGSKWRRFDVPVPRGARGAELQDASCVSATACVAVGDYVTSARTYDNRFYAMTWNGSALRQTAALPLPKGDSFAAMQAVSCVTARDCVALGSAQNAASDNVTIIERWNGAAWTMQVLPLTIGGRRLQLLHISCLSGTYCELAGVLTNLKNDSSSMFLGRWNGQSLAEQPASPPKGADPSAITSVSCATRNFCAASGESLLTLDSGAPFVETWNGKAWTATRVAVPKGDPIAFLWDVACPATRLCVTVGTTTTNANGSTPLALAYNGKTWSKQAVAAAVKNRVEAFASVSCPSVKLCLALGDSDVSGSPDPSSLAGFWNGKAWRLAAA